MHILNDPLQKAHYITMLDPCFSTDFNCDLLQYEHAQPLLRQGERLAYLYFLVHGKVKIYSTSLEGKRLIVAFNRPIQLFGDIEFLQQSSVLHTVEALGNVHVLRFSINEAKRLQHETAFNDFLLSLISRKFYTKSQVLSFHLLNDASIRFASYLLSITADDQPFIPANELTEIAEFIGITARHQNRLIKAFVEQHILQRTNKGIIICNRHLLQQKAAHNVYELQ